MKRKTPNLKLQTPKKFQIPNFKSQNTVVASAGRTVTQLARTVMDRIEALGKVSDEEGKLTRMFCSPAMRKANDLVASWMRLAGMEVREDAIGNVVGRYAGAAPQSQILVIGSHLDTVRDAGKFDGVLGVLVGIACVQRLSSQGVRLPVTIEIVGFADEEGVRYQSTYLGSKVLAGTFDRKDLECVDAEGTTMAEAVRSFGGNPDHIADARMDRKNLLGYVEVHIEQGPVLDKKRLSVGVVSAIAGQKRCRCNFLGQAGHAGTVPMNLRSDALCAAAEFIVAVESFAKQCTGLVATVGKIEALPGASNVIPGEVTFTLDVRHGNDRVRDKACSKLSRLGQRIAAKRGVQVKWEQVHATSSVRCDRNFSESLSRIVKRRQGKSITLPSGAGHDAAAMAAVTRVAMLFVRCKGGISHHPAESAAERDVRAAIEVLGDFIAEFGQ